MDDTYLEDDQVDHDDGVVVDGLRDDDRFDEDLDDSDDDRFDEDDQVVVGSW